MRRNARNCIVDFCSFKLCHSNTLLKIVKQFFFLPAPSPKLPPLSFCDLPAYAAIFFSWRSGECVRVFFLMSTSGSRCSLIGSENLVDSLPPFDTPGCQNYLPFYMALFNLASSILCYKVTH